VQQSGIGNDANVPNVEGFIILRIILYCAFSSVRIDRLLSGESVREFCRTFRDIVTDCIANANAAVAVNKSQKQPPNNTAVAIQPSLVVAEKKPRGKPRKKEQPQADIPIDATGIKKVTAKKRKKVCA
jgi:hypothetical protein